MSYYLNNIDALQFCLTTKAFSILMSDKRILLNIKNQHNWRFFDLLIMNKNPEILNTKGLKLDRSWPLVSDYFFTEYKYPAVWRLLSYSKHYDKRDELFQLERLQLLVNSPHVDVNQRSNTGETLIHKAMYLCRFDLVSYLIDQGVSTVEKTKEDYTIFDYLFISHVIVDDTPGDNYMSINRYFIQDIINIKNLLIKKQYPFSDQEKEDFNELIPFSKYHFK